MNVVRNRAGLIAAIALAWHVVAIAAVTTMLSCDLAAASEHAGMADCPLHESAPACPIHAEKHGTHECDCPTIGCSDTDTGLMALFGTVGVMPAAADIAVPFESGDASMRPNEFVNSLAPAPFAPPPRV